MANLIKDAWFWVSAVGFCVSSSLFVYLLSQYKKATGAPERQDAHEPEEIPLPPLKPVAVKSTGADKTLVLPPPAPAAPPPAKASAPAPAPAVAPPSAPAVEPSAAAVAQKKAETTTGGISPALVYMQNIKLQLDRLDKDLGSIKALLSKQESQQAGLMNQESLILKKLEELSSQVNGAAFRSPAAPLHAPSPAPEPPAASAPSFDLPMKSPEPAAPAPAPEPAPADPLGEFEARPHGAPLDALMAGSSLPQLEPQPVAEPAAELKPPAPAPLAADPLSMQLDVPPALAGLVANPPSEVPPPAPTIELPAPPPPPPPPPPAKNPDATIKLPNPTPMVLESPSEKPAESPEAKPARKGPVWPI